MEIKELQEKITLYEDQLKRTTEDVIIYKAALKDVLNTAFGADEYIVSVAGRLTSSFSMLDYYTKEIEKYKNELPQTEEKTEKAKAKEILFGGNKQWQTN